MSIILLLITGLIIPVSPGESIQDALDGAMPGDTVLVLPGVHTGSGSNLVQMNGSHNGVVLTGDHSNPSSVILSGAGLDESILFIDGQEAGEVDSTTVISGFTFQQGSSGSSPFGGAVHARHTTAVFHSNAFSNCSADNGGAVYVWKGAPAFRHCIFTENECESAGGALYLYSSDAEVKHCRFLDNTSWDDGGGIFCYHSSPVIFNCSFTGGYAHDDGGGIYCYALSNPLISFCTLVDNFALYTGSAVYFRVNSSATVSHCIATENQGPAFYIQDGGNPQFEFNCVWGNPDGNYGNLPDPTGTQGNISEDPLLTGDLFLSQVASGQTQNSPCVDAGSGIPDDYLLELTWTRTDSVPDTSIVDMGFHHGYSVFQSNPEQGESTGFSVFPNPASTSFTVLLPAQGQWDQLQVFDLSGRLIYSITSPEPGQSVSTEFIRRSGVYLVRITGESNSLAIPVTVILR